MKKIIFLCIAMVLLCSNVNAVEFKNTTYTYTFEINDTVYTDNEDVYIECQPHTIYGDSYVYLNFSFKKYTGNADIYFGFIDDSYPVNISLFDGKKYVEIKKEIESIKYNYNNKDYWHFINNIKIQKKNSIKIWIDIKEGVKNGKYDFAIKPTGRNMHDSINNKDFYILDPYYNTWYEEDCPRDGNYPCNNSMFIDIGNKKFLYIQSTYLCGDVTGDGIIDGRDSGLLHNYITWGGVWFPLRCNPPTMNYQILDYNNYVGTDIIRPLRSDIYD